jgi:hypothetical protein
MLFHLYHIIKRPLTPGGREARGKPGRLIGVPGGITSMSSGGLGGGVPMIGPVGNPGGNANGGDTSTSSTIHSTVLGAGPVTMVELLPTGVGMRNIPTINNGITRIAGALPVESTTLTGSFTQYPYAFSVSGA